MTCDLKKDLETLQARYAIDDSLIESLMHSPEQARAHIKFWVRMMWIVNGTLIGIFALLAGLAGHSIVKGGSVWWWGAAMIAICGLLAMLGVLARQRQAANAIICAARKHRLI